MVSVQEATSIILSNLFQPKAKEVCLIDSLGKILAEPILTDRDLPPYHRATMDGIALQYAAYQNGVTSFTIEAVQAAGEPQKKLSADSHCIEIMTGAMLPEETDTLVQYENLKIENGRATIIASSIEKGQNIHVQGSDAKKNQVLLPMGSLISPAEVALLASVGKTTVAVQGFPKTAITSTGNELVGVDQVPLLHQIRTSNSYALQAALSAIGGGAELFHLADDEEELKRELIRVQAHFDLIILSGGVSKGKFDFVPKVLESLGIQKLFHQISQRPGKPMWFGRAGNKFVFALPGNPVSTFMCFHRYLRPWLLKSLGMEQPTTKAILAEDFSFTVPLTYFLQVKVTNEDGKLLAYPIVGGGSGDFVNLKEVDGFLELPLGKNEFKAGEAYPLVSFRS
ncbi:MAG: molybdopterin molybdotransferase MoeA [Cyclobacteriaceae bacterium]